MASIPLQIGNTIINFPSTGSSPDWSQGVIAFAEAVALQLQGISSPFDVLPAVQVLNTDLNTNLQIAGATFPSDSVRSFIFDYAVYRTNGTGYVEKGQFVGEYNTQTGIWGLQRTFYGNKQTDGTSYLSFDMSGDNVVFSSVAIGGSYDSTNSTISYSAKTQLVVET